MLLAVRSYAIRASFAVDNGKYASTSKYAVVPPYAGASPPECDGDARGRHSEGILRTVMDEFLRHFPAHSSRQGYPHRCGAADQRGTFVAKGPAMLISKILGGVAVSAVLALSLACGPSEQARTVTNSDTTKTGPDGNSQTRTSDTQITSSDGSKESTHTEDVKQQPAK